MAMAPDTDGVGKQNSELAAMLGIQGAKTAGEFKAYFLDVFVKRSYRELDQPLGDLPMGSSDFFLNPERGDPYFCKSAKPGFTDLTNSSFFFRVQPLISFPRLLASRLLAKTS